jgi:putative aldouronate transport system substrate-binding protein
VERQVDLDKIRDETIFGIIIGELPMSAFDDYVAQWMSLGGDQIIQEVNEWWASRA